MLLHWGQWREGMRSRRGRGMTTGRTPVWEFLCVYYPRLQLQGRNSLRFLKPNE